MKIRPEFHYDKIVVGSGLPALLYAFLHDYPVVFKEASPPFFGDTIKLDKPEIFGFKEEEVKQIKLWTLLHIVLGVKGLLVSAGISTGIRYEPNQLRVITNNSFMKLNYKELIVFEPEHLNSFDYHYDIIEEKYEVLDWFYIREGAKWEIEKLEFQERNYVKQIWFHESERVTKPFLKDCVARSYLTKQELDDDTMGVGLTRVRVQQILREKGTDQYAVIVFDEREIKNISTYKYHDKENITFLNNNPQEIWDNHKNNQTESTKLCQKLHTLPELSQ
jgi:hypothetical protein